MAESGLTLAPVSPGNDVTAEACTQGEEPISSRYDSGFLRASAPPRWKLIQDVLWAFAAGVAFLDIRD